MSKIRIRHVSENGFDRIREADGLTADVFYVLPNQVGYTPDGVGCIWYDTLAEALAAHE